MDHTVRFKTRHVGGHGKSAGDVWTAKILPNRTVDQMQLAVMLAENGGYAADTINYILTHMWLKIIDLLRMGCNVNLDGVRFSLQATGTLPYANAEFDPERNHIVARATIARILRDAPRTRKEAVESHAKTPLLKPVNVLPRSIGTTKLTLVDSRALGENIITVPSMIYIAGMRIRVTPGQPDEGVQFISHKDGSAYAARILQNDSGTIDCELDELPPTGEYTLLVRARNGAPLSLAPGEARCVVIVDPDYTGAQSAVGKTRRRRRRS